MDNITYQYLTPEAIKDLHQHFDAVEYLKSYTEIDVFMAFVLWALHSIFFRNLVKGTNLLDVGSGPCIYSVISSSTMVTNITLSDLVPQNRDQLLKWINKNPEAHKWTFAFEYVAILENTSDSRNVEQRLRDKIKDVIPIDVYQTNPITPRHQQFDIVTSALCLEGACVTKQQLHQALTNLATLICPNGYLVLASVFGDSGYKVGEVFFPTLSIQREDLKMALNKAGFAPKTWFLEDVTDQRIEYSEIYVVVAQKM